MKDLRKIIALFIFIFIAGVGIIIGSIHTKLDETKSVEKVEISTDSTYSNTKVKKSV